MFACFVVVAGSRSLLLWVSVFDFRFRLCGFFPVLSLSARPFFSAGSWCSNETNTIKRYPQRKYTFISFLSKQRTKKNTKYLMMMMMIWFSSRLWFWIVRSIFTLFVFNASEHFDTSHTQNSLSLLFSIVTFQTECILIQIHTFGIQRTLSS